jgi:tRNA-splicing endonuclease subunit Sen15, fungi type
MENDKDEALAAMRNLRSVVRSNLEHQHYWTHITALDTTTDLKTHADKGSTFSIDREKALPRPMLYGRPPEQLYVSDQSSSTGPTKEAHGQPKNASVDYEYVLPVHLDEKWTIRQWAVLFDALPIQKAIGVIDQKKRIVVAVVSGDSTVVYYIMHDGVVKPRQN